LDFLFLLHADGGISGDVKASEKAYQKFCARRISCVGGDQTSCDRNSTESWADYVKQVNTDKPGLMEATHLLNSDLLSPIWHPIKHKVIRDATVAYFAWSGNLSNTIVIRDATVAYFA
jgi:hypothetical protein